MDQTGILKHRLRDIDRRRAEIEATLEYELPGSAKRYELEIEFDELAALRRVTDARLHELTNPRQPDANALAEREAQIEARIRERTESIRWNTDRLEAAGEHQQARILRQTTLNLREEVEREFPRVA